MRPGSVAFAATSASYWSKSCSMWSISTTLLLICFMKISQLFSTATSAV